MAKILCGKEASAELRKNLQLEVSSYGPNFKPGLTIVQVCILHIVKIHIKISSTWFHEIHIKISWNWMYETI